MAKHAAKKVGGLFTAIITPFDDRGRVDVEALSKLVRFQVTKGADGIFPCGSTGLGPMLNVPERKEIAKAAIESAKGRIPVVVQVGCADTNSTIELAKHAEASGAYAVASLTPYYYKPGERAAIKHFETISKAVDIPLLAYNIPPFTGNNLSPSAVATMAKNGTVQGIKDSSRDLLHLLDLIDAVPEEFVVMNGTEEYALFAIMSGADGLVSGGASALPEVFKSLVAAQKKGDYKGAVEVQKDIQQIKDLVKPGPIAAYYSILRERGIDCGRPRAPMLPLEDADARRVVEGLRSKGFI